MSSDNDVREVAGCQRIRDRTSDCVGSAQHGDPGERYATDDKAVRFSCDRARLRATVGAAPKLHLGAGPAGPQLFGKALRTVRDQCRSGRDDAARASMVASERDGERRWKTGPKPLEAGA